MHLLQPLVQVLVALKGVRTVDYFSLSFHITTHLLVLLLLHVGDRHVQHATLKHALVQLLRCSPLSIPTSNALIACSGNMNVTKQYPLLSRFAFNGMNTSVTSPN